MRIVTLAILAVVVAFASGNMAKNVAAQGVGSPPLEGSRSGVIPPCPTIAEQKAAAGERTKDGIPAAPVQPAEGSIILPSAGGDSASGAPSAQQDGRAVRSPLDCPMADNHPNAQQPGTPLPDELKK